MSQVLMKTNGLTLNGSLRALKITYLTKYFASSVDRWRKNIIEWNLEGELRKANICLLVVLLQTFINIVKIRTTS